MKKRQSFFLNTTSYEKNDFQSSSLLKKHRKKEDTTLLGVDARGLTFGWREDWRINRPTYSQVDSTPHTKGEKISILLARVCSHTLDLSRTTLPAAVAAPLLCMPWRILKRSMPQVCVRVCVCGKAACVCEARNGVCVCVRCKCLDLSNQTDVLRNHLKFWNPLLFHPKISISPSNCHHFPNAGIRLVKIHPPLIIRLSKIPNW